MKKIIILLFTAALTLLWACDVVDKPYTEQVNQCGHDNLSVPIRKVLVEDYTGHKCGNCPRAHELLQTLISQYCDHIVPVSIHVGYFATPSPGLYNTDFRTPAGNTYNDYFGVDAAGLPRGMINRTKYNGTLLLSPEAWADAINKEVNEPLLADVQANCLYNSETRQGKATVQISFLQQMQGKFSLTVWIVEDSIIAAQKDYYTYPQDIPDYVHRNVLRKSITPAWGETVYSGQTNVNQIITKTYTFSLDTAWVAKHCYIVAFLSNADTKEVYQAEREKITE